jgi:hypothetical protein
MKKFSGWLMAGGLMLILLTSCAPDPRKEAQAKAIVIQAEQSAADAEQLRAINARKEADEAKQAAWWRNVWDSGLETAKSAMNVFVNVISFALMVSVCIVLLGGGWTAKETMIGLGHAAVMRAELNAQLIHMDENTRTFPALFTISNVDGLRVLTVTATGQKLLMDSTANPADPRLIAALAQVSTAGVLANAASNPKADAAGIAMINPTVIDIQA